MISPQGYQLGADPKNKNPFWDEGGEDSSVNRIYATATVDDKTGVPKVDTSKTVSGSDITFNFGFHNIKGEKGETGPEGPAGPEGEPGQDGFSPQVILSPISNGYNMRVIDGTGEQEVTIANGEKGETGPEGPAGPEGEPGQDGFSPQVILSPISNGYNMRVIDGTGEQEVTIANGEKGETGPEGPAGPGVPAGGTAGQILTKVDGTDYNTEWMDPKRSSSDINFKIYETEVQVSEWTYDTSTDMYYCEVPENSELLSILLPYLRDPEHSVPIPENKCLSVVVTWKVSSFSAAGGKAYNYITNISVNNRSVSVSITASRTFLALEAPYKPVIGKYNIKVLYYE